MAVAPTAEEDTDMVATEEVVMALAVQAAEAEEAAAPATAVAAMAEAS